MSSVHLSRSFLNLKFKVFSQESFFSFALMVISDFRCENKRYKANEIQMLAP